MKLLIGEKIPNFWPIFRAYPTYGPFALDIPHTRDRTLTSKDDNVSGVIFPISYRLYESVWSNYFAFMIVHFQRKSFSIKKIIWINQNLLGSFTINYEIVYRKKCPLVHHQNYRYSEYKIPELTSSNISYGP